MTIPRALFATFLLAVASALAWRVAVTPVRFVAALGVIYVSAWATAFIWSRASRRTIVFSLLSVHLALGCVVAILEVPAFMTWVDYRRVFHTPSFFFPTRDPDYKQDPELGYLAPPNAQQRGKTAGNIAVLYQVPDARTYSYEVNYDDRGFRNPQAVERADIALVGDSFVHGVFVPQAQLASTVLGTELRQSVYNLGQLAYGPQQEAAIVRRYALPLGVRTIVWMFYEGNDLQDIVSFHEFERDYAAATGKRHNLVARSFTRNLLATLGTLAGKAHESALPRSTLWTHGGTTERLYFLEPARTWSASDDASFHEFSTIFEPVARACAAKGVQLVLAFAPTKYRVLRPLVTVPEGSQLTTWQLNDLPNRLEALSRQMPGEVSYIDLTGPLEARARRGDLPYFADDTHWNAVGHEVVGRALAAAIDKDRRR